MGCNKQNKNIQKNKTKNKKNARTHAQNILLRSTEDDLSFVLADFGFAGHAHDLATKELLGTADYVAPEVGDRAHAHASPPFSKHCCTVTSTCKLG